MSLRTFFRVFSHLQMLPILESGQETLVGGQAVMEGVMMRAPHSYCVAVRRPDGDIVTDEFPVSRMSEKYPIFKLPVFRGIGTLGQAMGLGMKALRFSADAFLTEPGKEAKAVPQWAMAANAALSVLFFIFMYKFVPLWLATRIGHAYPALNGQLASNAVDGVIRMIIFIGFLLVLSRAKDIRRVFEYHGAEHKVVFNFESGVPVSVENAQKFETWHPRCGTSFLLVVMVISTLLYMAVPIHGFALKMLFRIAMLPFIVGISYELIRFAAKGNGAGMRLLTAPGLWLQRITTKPPSDDQAEVAIVALDRAMKLEARQGGELVIA